MSVSVLAKQLLDAVMFREIWNAMKVTFTHMFHRPITFQYPREERTIPDTHRGALAMLKKYAYSSHDKRTLLFDKKRLYEIGERFIEDSKKYLYAHNQEKSDQMFHDYRYFFPQSVLKPTQPLPPKHLT